MYEGDRRRNLPDLGHMSQLVATILLAYALASFVNLPGRQFAVQLPFFYLELSIDGHTVVAALVAALTATGAIWLLRDHAALGKQNLVQHSLVQHSLVQHTVLPALTAWVLGVPLLQLPLSLAWWGGFALGGILLMLVLLAEYITIDPGDLRQPLAAAWLTAVSFALYLILAASLRYAGTRLFLLLPSLTLAVGLASLRTLRLRLHGDLALLPAGIVTLVTGQVAAALHYWPLSPVAFGLALLGLAYALTSLMGNLAEGEPPRQAALEPLIVLGLVWGVALWLG